MKNTLSAIKGSLIGGAIGDALGYPVEFLRRERILSRYGEEGIQAYELDKETGLALISDDTQMTLFTLVGLLIRETQSNLRGIADPQEVYIWGCYRQGWYRTQIGERLEDNSCCLLDLPQLWDRRAPGGTCLTALGSGRIGTLEKRINSSKGCGGVMRVAPIGLYAGKAQTAKELKHTAMTSAKVAAITHGHSLGILPAAALAQILSRAAFGGCPYEDGLYGIVRECRELMQEWFQTDSCLPEFLEIIDKAVEMAQSDWEDHRCICSIGEGWVAEEALAIALFCALRYPDDFSKAVIAAVNHGGDSDSTGAITGNILGAWLGMEGIESKWLEKLELRDEILELAEDLHNGCPLDEYSDTYDKRWEQKYILHHWPQN